MICAGRSVKNIGVRKTGMSAAADDFLLVRLTGSR